jgi:hypothetical protein
MQSECMRRHHQTCHFSLQQLLKMGRGNALQTRASLLFSTICGLMKMGVIFVAVHDRTTIVPGFGRTIGDYK